MEEVTEFHIVGNRNLAAASEENWENLANVLVRIRVRELSIALSLLVFTIYKCSIYPITNPNPSIVTPSRDNIKLLL
jgi:hypothetical protein